eukprot:NODE_8422_length_384_cov_188.319149.p3 GENE.NODE_8422_length_384_cov_188.319149~~NODE_8422_length_384_cov_188.319149.p3  ORF type:complete len:106 (+),score=28.64 NODE_8422_length_384_cov_188.319149:3-320(+)
MGKVFPAEFTDRPRESANFGSLGLPSGHSSFDATIVAWIALEWLWAGTVGWLFAVVVLALMSPVPWARVYVQDHTTMQVLVGGLSGALTGVCLFVIRVTYFHETS